MIRRRYCMGRGTGTDHNADPDAQIQSSVDIARYESTLGCLSRCSEC